MYTHTYVPPPNKPLVFDTKFGFKAAMPHL